MLMLMVTPAVPTISLAPDTLFRDLAAGRVLVHDEATADVDEAVLAAQVRESASGGLILGPRGRTHLIRALVWATCAAHRPTPRPVIR